MKASPELQALIVMTSAYYGQKLDDHVVAMYAEDLSDLPVPSVKQALQKLRRDPSITRFPLPAKIRNEIQPANTTDEDAREAASRIISAVARFGWNNPDRAKEYVGELAWYVVDRQGGWLNVCQMVEHKNLTSLQAQFRDLAASAVVRAKAGTIHKAPSLPFIQVAPTLTVFPKSQEQRQLEKLQLQLEQIKAETEDR